MSIRRSHPAQYGETFDWSANLIAQQCRATRRSGYILSSLREERLGEKDGAFYNGIEGRVDFRITVRKPMSVFEPFDMKEKDL